MSIVETIDGQKCAFCGHLTENNHHGIDQGDGDMDGDKFVHSGSCTYCIVCNPRLELPSTWQSPGYFPNHEREPKVKK